MMVMLSDDHLMIMLMLSCSCSPMSCSPMIMNMLMIHLMIPVCPPSCVPPLSKLTLLGWGRCACRLEARTAERLAQLAEAVATAETVAAAAAGPKDAPPAKTPAEFLALQVTTDGRPPPAAAAVGAQSAALASLPGRERDTDRQLIKELPAMRNRTRLVSDRVIELKRETVRGCGVALFFG